MSETSEKRLEKVRFMNMCMIQDGRGNVLALDKVNDSYTGTTFPGGHVEPGELFFQSMIREVWEETGLTIENPEFRGLYHWHKDGVHHVITLYRAYTFCGELESSEEGRVYWISLEELKAKKLASGMEYVLEMMESETIKECYVRREADRYVGVMEFCIVRNNVYQLYVTGVRGLGDPLPYTPGKDTPDKPDETDDVTIDVTIYVKDWVKRTNKDIII